MSPTMKLPLCASVGHEYWDDVWCPICKHCNKTYYTLLAERYTSKPTGPDV